MVQPPAGRHQSLASSFLLGTPSRTHEKPAMETWMATLESGTMEWWDLRISMMSTVMLKT